MGCGRATDGLWQGRGWAVAGPRMDCGRATDGPRMGLATKGYIGLGKAVPAAGGWEVVAGGWGLGAGQGVVAGDRSRHYAIGDNFGDGFG